MNPKLWRVLVTTECEQEIQQMNFTPDERLIIASWIRFVEEKGPYLLSDFKIQDFKDHALTRQSRWNNHRSSSFSHSGRIIYRIEDRIVTVIVVRITRHHNYK